MGAFQDSSSLRCLPADNYMSFAKGMAGFWLCGQGTDFANVGELLSYLDNLTTPLASYNILLISPVIETGNYSITNTSLTSFNISAINPAALWNLSDYQVLDFSAIGFAIDVSFGNCGNIYLEYNYSTSKTVIVPSSGGVRSLILNAYIYNASPDGIDTLFIDGNNSTFVYSNSYTTLYVDNSSHGGIDNVIWGGGDLSIYGVSSTVKNVLNCATTGINTTLNRLTIGGNLADGTGYINPIIDCYKLVLTSLYISVTGPVTINAVEGFIPVVGCDLGEGYPLFNSTDKLKLGPSFTNTGRALLYDGGSYTFDGVTWEGLDLDGSFDECSLKVLGNRFSGSGEGIIGNDFTENTASTVTTSGTTETTLFTITTSSYTFPSNKSGVTLWGHFNNAIALGNLTFRVKINGTQIMSFATTQAGDGDFNLQIFRTSNNGIRSLLDYNVTSTLSSVALKQDTTVNTLAPITIAITAQMSNASDVVSMYATTFKVITQY